MNKKIKVKCINGFKLNKRNILYAEAIKNRQYTAILCEESNEYFSKDDKGHEFLVGELDLDGNLRLNEDFELVN